MGNVPGKTSTSSSEPDLKSSGNHQKGIVTVSGNVSEQTSYEVSVSDPAIQSRSGCPSFSSLKSDSSHSRFTRPWRRVSRKRCDKGINTDFGLSKTTWPVPFFESLFLPEFKIRDKVNEDSFRIIEAVSSGAFSKVYKVVKTDDGGIYAMKVLSKAQVVASNLINQVKEEVHIQRVVGHNPFIVKCPYHWQSRKQLFIISEYISGGELFKLVQEKGSLPLEILKLYVAQLALALDFLHNAGIIYRDMKLENILLNDKGCIQIIDFGLSKWLKYGSRTNTICGTLQYIAPEILQRKPYGHAADWWSLGIVVVYMSTGRYPYESCLDDGGSVRPLPDFDWTPEVRDLIHRLLAVDPLQRLRSLTALKRTALYMGFDFDSVLNCVVDLNALTVIRPLESS